MTLLYFTYFYSLYVIFWLCQSVGMRPLERSLEKLDDVRRKKLSEMIASSGGESAGTSSGLWTSIPHIRYAEHQVLYVFSSHSNWILFSYKSGSSVFSWKHDHGGTFLVRSPVSLCIDLFKYFLRTFSFWRKKGRPSPKWKWDFDIVST